MTMLKRAAALSLVLCLMAMGLAACSPSDDDTAQTTTTAATTTTVATTTTMKKAVLEADNLSVRSGPGFDEEVIGGIFKGDELEIIGREGDWFKINFGDGEGYVNAQYVDVEDAPNASEMQASCPTTKVTTTKPTKKGETTKKGQTTTTTVKTTKAGGPTQPPEPTNPDGSGVGNKAPSLTTTTTTTTKAAKTTTTKAPAADNGGSPVIPDTASDDAFN